MLRAYLNRGEEECDGWVWVVEDGDAEYLLTIQVPHEEGSEDYDIRSTTLYRLIEREGFFDLSTERVEYIDADYGPIATLNPEGE